MLKKLSRAVFGNLKLKLLALVISLAVWFYAARQVTEELDLFVPVHIQTTPGYQILKQSSEFVRLRIAGPQSLAGRLRTESAQGYLKMSPALNQEQLRKGRARLRAEPAWLNIPESELIQLRVTYQSPSEITVYVSPITERTLPVREQLMGEPRTGFEIVGTSVVPSRVKVRGPELALERLEYIQTQPLVIWNIDSDFRRDDVALLTEDTVELDNGEEAPVQLQLSSKTVSVKVAVSAQEQERPFEDVPVEFLMPLAFPFEVEIPPEERSISVIVRGLPHNLERLRPESFRAYIDLRDLANEKIPVGGSHPYKENVTLHLMGDVPVSSARAVPDRVTIKLKHARNRRD